MASPSDPGVKLRSSPEDLDGAGVGDAGHTDEEVEVLLEVRIGSNKVPDLLTEVGDLGLEVLNALLEMGQKKVRHGSVLPGGMELICPYRLKASG